MPYPGYDKILDPPPAEGDDYRFRGNFKRVPAGQRIVAATLSIKQHPTDDDSAALYLTTITTIPDADGNVIEDDGSIPRSSGYGWAKLKWTLPASLTVQLKAGQEFYYGTQVRSSAGRVHEPEHGVIITIQQIYRGT